MIFIIKKMDAVISKIGILFLTLLGVLTVVQVLFRYVFNYPLSWTEEVARYFFIWTTFIGLYINMITNDHYRIDFFYNLFNKNFQKKLDFIFSLLIHFFLIVIIINSFSIITANAHIKSANNITINVIYISLPLLSIFILIRKFLVLLTHTRTEKDQK